MITDLKKIFKQAELA